MFSNRLGKAILCSIRVREHGVQPEFCFAQSDTGTEVAEEGGEPKRRRLFGKFHPDQIFVPSDGPAVPDESSQTTAIRDVPDVSGSVSLPAVNQALQMAEQCTPRVGKKISKKAHCLI